MVALRIRSVLRLRIFLLLRWITGQRLCRRVRRISECWISPAGRVLRLQCGVRTRKCLNPLRLLVYLDHLLHGRRRHEVHLNPLRLLIYLDSLYLGPLRLLVYLDHLHHSRRRHEHQTRSHLRSRCQCPHHGLDHLRSRCQFDHKSRCSLRRLEVHLRGGLQSPFRAE